MKPQAALLGLGLSLIGGFSLVGASNYKYESYQSPSPFTPQPELVSTPLPGFIRIPLFATGCAAILGGSFYFSGVLAKNLKVAAQLEVEEKPKKVSRPPSLQPEREPVATTPPSPTVIEQPVQFAQPKTTFQWEQEDEPVAPSSEPEIEEDEYEDVRKLVHRPTVLIYGEMGGGKTSKQGWLVGEHVKLGHQVAFVNPLAPHQFYRGVQTFGQGIDYDNATKGIAQFVKEVNRRLRDRGHKDYNPFNDPHLHLACDEVTNWGDRIDERVMADLLEVATQQLRQAHASLSISSHGDTLACMGGVKAGAGKSDVLKRQFTRLQCVAKANPNVPGGLSCAGYAYLRSREGNDDVQKRVLIPSWMQPPNPGVSPAGIKYYDYRPLIPAPKDEFAELARRAAELKEEN